jgi:hypothetical protein
LRNNYLSWRTPVDPGKNAKRAVRWIQDWASDDITTYSVKVKCAIYLSATWLPLNATDNNSIVQTDGLLTLTDTL